MESRTERRFTYAQPIWSQVEAWAATHGYKPKGEEGGARIWQKGTGFLTAPMMLAVRQQGDAVHLQAWIRVNLFVRICGLMLIPASMGIASGGFKLVVPRKIARTAVNALLAALGQAPVA